MSCLTLSAKPAAMVLDVKEIASPKGTVSKNINISLARVSALQHISSYAPPASPSNSEDQNSEYQMEEDPEQDPASVSTGEEKTSPLRCVAFCRKTYACDKMFENKTLEGALLHHRNALRHFEDKDLAKAKKEFAMALQLDPQNAPALSDLGVLHFFEHRFDEAVKSFEEALKYDEHHAGSQFNLGLLYGGRGEMEKAKEQLQRCIAHNPEHRNARLTLADILRREGKDAEADAMLRMTDAGT